MNTVVDDLERKRKDKLKELRREKRRLHRVEDELLRTVSDQKPGWLKVEKETGKIEYLYDIAQQVHNACTTFHS